MTRKTRNRKGPTCPTKHTKGGVRVAFVGFCIYLGRFRKRKHPGFGLEPENAEPEMAPALLQGHTEAYKRGGERGFCMFCRASGLFPKPKQALTKLTARLGE